MIDGEMQADTAVTPQIIEETYPFSTLKVRQCADLPDSGSGEHRLQAAAAGGRRGNDRAVVDGLTRRCIVAARQRGQRHRPRGRGRRGGRTGNRQALCHADRGCGEK